MNSQTQKTPVKTASSLTNIFNDLPALQPPKAAMHRDELEKYLSTDCKLHINDGLLWWHELKHIYPCLSRMALDYLSIPGKLSLFIVNRVTHKSPIHTFAATSVHVERTFSQGWLLLSHVHSHLSVQSTHALLVRGDQ